MTIFQYWFRKWLGIGKRHAITGFGVDPSHYPESMLQFCVARLQMKFDMEPVAHVMRYLVQLTYQNMTNFSKDDAYQI